MLIVSVNVLRGRQCAFMRLSVLLCEWSSYPAVSRLTSTYSGWDSREFKKLRRQLQRKRHIKIELCVKLSLSWLFHVGHVVQNRRSVLSLAWYEWFICKGKEWKIYCCDPALSSEAQIWKFHVVVWQTTSKHCTKKRAARAARLFSSFNQSNHWFVTLSSTLPSSTPSWWKQTPCISKLLNNRLCQT